MESQSPTSAHTVGSVSFEHFGVGGSADGLMPVGNVLQGLLAVLNLSCEHSH